MNATADRAVVLTVVACLGLLSLVGLLGVIWLVHDGTASGELLAITGIAGPAAGALAGILATTRTTVAAVHEAKAEGFQQAVDAVTALDPTAVPVQVMNDPGEPVPVEPQDPPKVRLSRKPALKKENP